MAHYQIKIIHEHTKGLKSFKKSLREIVCPCFKVFE